MAKQPAGTIPPARLRDTPDAMKQLVSGHVFLAEQGGFAGTAFGIAPGLMATAEHVVEGNEPVSLTSGRGGKPMQGTVVSRIPSEHGDVALLKVPEYKGPGLPLARPGTGTSDTFYHAIGFPGDDISGSVATLWRGGAQYPESAGGYKQRFITSEVAGGGPGLSGGPVLNQRGEVVGVVKSGAERPGQRPLMFHVPLDRLRGIVERRSQRPHEPMAAPAARPTQPAPVADPDPVPDDRAFPFRFGPEMPAPAPEPQKPARDIGAAARDRIATEHAFPIKHGMSLKNPTLKNKFPHTAYGIGSGYAVVVGKREEFDSDGDSGEAMMTTVERARQRGDDIPHGVAGRFDDMWTDKLPDDRLIALINVGGDLKGYEEKKGLDIVRDVGQYPRYELATEAGFDGKLKSALREVPKSEVIKHRPYLDAQGRLIVSDRVAAAIAKRFPPKVLHAPADPPFDRPWGEPHEAPFVRPAGEPHDAPFVRPPGEPHEAPFVRPEGEPHEAPIVRPPGEPHEARSVRPPGEPLAAPDPSFVRPPGEPLSAPDPSFRRPPGEPHEAPEGPSEPRERGSTDLGEPFRAPPPGPVSPYPVKSTRVWDWRLWGNQPPPADAPAREITPKPTGDVKKVKIGDERPKSAEAFNALMSSAEMERGRREALDIAATYRTEEIGTVLVRNDSGQDAQWYDVLGVAAPLADPGEQ